MKSVADTSVVISLLTSEQERRELLPERKSKYNLPDVNLDLNREEIVRFVRESRNRER